jgi:hypothetical protein
MGTTGSFTGDKAARREADHLPTSSVDVKNGGAITPHKQLFGFTGAQNAQRAHLNINFIAISVFPRSTARGYEHVRI